MVKKERKERKERKKGVVKRNLVNQIKQVIKRKRKNKY